MSDQQVPWAPGRLALIAVEDDWLVGDGALTSKDRKCWTFRSHPPAYIEEVDSLLISGQCPRCYEVGAHAEGCMVAANIARGVFPHFAPWVMWTLPDKARIYAIPGVVLMSLNLDYAAHPARSAVVTWNDGWEDGRPVFAIGPEGFTLKPWEET